MRRNSATFAILAGGAIAGAIDITYAIVFSGFRGVPATRILQSVASGLLGAGSYRGGAPAAAPFRAGVPNAAAALRWRAARRCRQA